jgi:phosphoribosyl 1,2-cyclic phosphodiesterase
VDCGLGIRVMERRLAQAGLSTADIDAIFITHEHGDHVGCARALALRERIPVWMSHGTWTGHGAADFDGMLNIAAHAEPIDIGNLRLLPFTVPHDALEPLQLTCSDGASRLGVLTDLGHAPAGVLAQLADCQALLLECNHDPDLLAASSYPPFLKRRVGGSHGHLANTAAAAIVEAVRHDGLRHVVAAHLSARNNRPALARAALARVMGCADDDITVADAVIGTGWIPA